MSIRLTTEQIERSSRQIADAISQRGHKEKLRLRRVWRQRGGKNWKGDCRAKFFWRGKDS